MLGNIFRTQNETKKKKTQYVWFVYVQSQK